MWYIIGYIVIAAFVAAILRTVFKFGSGEDEDEIFALVMATVFWPLTIAAGIFYLLYKLFCLLVKLFEKLIDLGVNYLKKKL